jgi:hypothetical protein
MAKDNIESNEAAPFIRNLKSAVRKLSADGRADSIEPAPEQRSKPGQAIEVPLEIDPSCGISRIGIEALEGLLAEIGADDALTLHLSLGDETPVRIGLAQATPDTDRQQVLSAALDLAANLIKTEQRA